MRRAIAIILPLAMLVAACQRESGGDPLELTGKIFVFNYRLAYATYLVTLQRSGAVPDGAVVRAEFEDPAGGPPLTLERKLFAGLDRIVLESPDISCVKKGHPYRITIALLDAQGEPLQELETTLTASADQSALPAKALVVGPAYEKNPEVFRNGETPARFEMAACPQ